MRHWNRILPLFTTLILLGACASAPQPESAQDSGLKEAQSILKNIASFKKLACDPMAVTTAINSSIFYSKCSSGGSNPASPPAAPTNLSVETQAGDYTGWFSWVNVASDASTVQIHYRQLEPFETDWSTLVSLDASRNSHVEEDYLEDGFKYDFQVKAVNNDGSTGSNIVTATIGAVTDKTPRPPINLGHSFSSTNTIGLIWESMSNNEDEFVIFRGRLSGALLEIDSTTEEEYLDEGLSPETRYFYQVSARNDVGNSGFSEGYISATTTEEPVVIPLAPLNVVATALSPNEIQLTWDDVSNNEDAFLIYRRSPSLSETEFSPAGMIIEGDNDDATPQNPIPMEYVDGNVSPEQTYIYYIIAIDSSTGTESLPSDPTDIVETPAEELPPLAVPENVVAQALSGSTVEVTWSYTPGGTPDGYCVHRFIPPTGAVLLVGEVQGASEIRFEDDSVTAGTTYAYAVSAFRGSCDSVVGEQSDSSDTDTSTPAVMKRVLDNFKNVGGLPLYSMDLNLVSWNVDTPSDAIEDVINEEVLNCARYILLKTFDQEPKDYLWPAAAANQDNNEDGEPDSFLLTEVDHFHAYWIRFLDVEEHPECENPLLRIGGEFVPPDTPIPLQAGWNSISYFPTDPRPVDPCYNVDPDNYFGCSEVDADPRPDFENYVYQRRIAHGVLGGLSIPDVFQEFDFDDDGTTEPYVDQEFGNMFEETLMEFLITMNAVWETNGIGAKSFSPETWGLWRNNDWSLPPGDPVKHFWMHPGLGFEIKVTEDTELIYQDIIQ